MSFGDVILGILVLAIIVLILAPKKRRGNSADPIIEKSVAWMPATFSEAFGASTIELRDTFPFPAFVIVDDGKDVRIIAEGPRELVERLRLVSPIDGHATVSVVAPSSVYSRFDGVHTHLSLDNVDVGHGDLRLIVRVPMRTAVRVTGSADVRIGDTHGPLDVDLDMGMVTAGAVGALQVTNRSIGSVDVRYADGVRHEIRVAGTGDVHIDEIRGEEIVLIANSVGEVNVTDANAQRCRLEASGVGDVYVKNGRVAQLTLVVTSIGDVSFGGSAGHAEIIRSGMGDARVAHLD